jgi:hypothetical protein
MRCCIHHHYEGLLEDALRLPLKDSSYDDLALLGAEDLDCGYQVCTLKGIDSSYIQFAIGCLGSELDPVALEKSGSGEVLAAVCLLDLDCKIETMDYKYYLALNFARSRGRHRMTQAGTRE